MCFARLRWEQLGSSTGLNASPGARIRHRGAPGQHISFQTSPPGDEVRTEEDDLLGVGGDMLRFWRSLATWDGAFAWGYGLSLPEVEYALGIIEALRSKACGVS